ncbi:MAG: 50S ribosomal protein L29 [Nitrospinota bacterium]|nr:50S ribosomal protein L29 [Nitrospinota bacterium]
MKIQEIKELSEKERDEKLNDLREEYFNLKFQLATGKIENPGRLKYMRRDIARILTLKNNQPAPEAAQADSEADSKKADKK